MTDLDLAPPPEPPPPRLARRYGPSNAAGFGGWCGVTLPLLAVAGWWGANWTVTRGTDAGEVLKYSFILAAWAFMAVVPGYFCGWVGGAIARWLRRRRGAEWPPRRTEFAGGFAAATAFAAGIVWLIVSLNS
ncbi:hypothetical protein [Alienimonas chondri]|uniref:DUF4190 domain-containing protein n=1 Tax=Alienimonas chondri TaxID=2681879 RepID=A0ABX1VAN0_9PLAN|nr:hypothetical protein [Alienimonas chondri]NNJ25152.1 hypothetical protein [Alienimonas chondri]